MTAAGGWIEGAGNRWLHGARTSPPRGDQARRHLLVGLRALGDACRPGYSAPRAQRHGHRERGRPGRTAGRSRPGRQRAPTRAIPVRRRARARGASGGRFTKTGRPLAATGVSGVSRAIERRAQPAGTGSLHRGTAGTHVVRGSQRTPGDQRPSSRTVGAGRGWPGQCRKIHAGQRAARPGDRRDRRRPADAGRDLVSPRIP